MKDPLPKSEWGPGPWQEEPDFLSWTHAGLPCLIIRNMHVTGSLCGYVGVGGDHPWFGKGYGDCVATPTCPEAPPLRSSPDFPLSAALEERFRHDVRYDCRHAPEAILEVHGGITFAGQAMGYGEEPIPSGFWWFGFDTGHAWDQSPLMDATLFHLEIRTGHINPFRDAARLADHQSYKKLGYVKGEVRSLAKQLAKVRVSPASRGRKRP